MTTVTVVSSYTSMFCICHYRMAKIFCHTNHCDASVQYFAILHAHKYCTMSRKPRRLKMNTLSPSKARIRVAVRCDSECGKKYLSRDKIVV